MPWIAPLAAASPRVGPTFLAKNGKTNFPKLIRALKNTPCFCNCVLLNSFQHYVQTLWLF